MHSFHVLFLSTPDKNPPMKAKSNKYQNKK